MTRFTNRREFLRHLGLGVAALPFLSNLPSLAMANSTQRKQRLVVMFSPNGVVPKTFWPTETGHDFTLPESLAPLESLRQQTLIMRGIADKIRGDGDNHMRGIGCLLTGIELYPGNIQGGSATPAGWARGHSIDQELKSFLQSQPATRTRFGSLEMGVCVPRRADTWTRMVYAAGNKPIAPIDDPYQMFNKLYGQTKNRDRMRSVLDEVYGDLQKLSQSISLEDRRLLEEHTTFVRQMEQELAADTGHDGQHPVPELEPGVRYDHVNMPRLAKMQVELLVNSFAADFARIATLQYTNSVGNVRMRWLDVDEGHHELSHQPDSDEAAQEKLTRINRWYCEQFAYLATRLAETPEPGGNGSLLDNTLLVWTNELGKGNSHTLKNVPFVAVGGGLDWQMGRSLDFADVPHNRLLLSIAHGFGHHLKHFGSPDYCGKGPLTGLS